MGENGKNVKISHSITQNILSKKITKVEIWQRRTLRRLRDYHELELFLSRGFFGRVASRRTILGQQRLNQDQTLL